MSLETREHRALDGTVSRAVFSSCGDYRYRLSRRWSNDPSLAFIMLNPSTADEQANDPTIARCETRGRTWGYGGIEIVNLFAYRATDPKDLKKAEHPEGPDNVAQLARALDDAGLILAAWGVHGTHRDQDQKVLSDLGGYDLHVLGLTKAGLPRHPLYVGYGVEPQPWHPERA